MLRTRGRWVRISLSETDIVKSIFYCVIISGLLSKKNQFFIFSLFPYIFSISSLAWYKQLILACLWPWSSQWQQNFLQCHNLCMAACIYKDLASLYCFMAAAPFARSSFLWYPAVDDATSLYLKQLNENLLDNSLSNDLRCRVWEQKLTVLYFFFFFFFFFFIFSSSLNGSHVIPLIISSKLALEVDVLGFQWYIEVVCVSIPHTVKKYSI